jgi:hypothetical protein
MPLAFLLDENVPRRLWRAIEIHNARGLYPLDVVRVGEPIDLSLGSDDPTILLWAEREGRIVVTEDKNTMPGHLVQHLRNGRHSPGILLLRLHCPLAEIVEMLVLIAYASDPGEWQDREEYIP